MVNLIQFSCMVFCWTASHFSSFSPKLRNLRKGKTECPERPWFFSEQVPGGHLTSARASSLWATHKIGSTCLEKWSKTPNYTSYIYINSEWIKDTNVTKYQIFRGKHMGKFILGKDPRSTNNECKNYYSNKRLVSRIRKVLKQLMYYYKNNNNNNKSPFKKWTKEWNTDFQLTEEK